MSLFSLPPRADPTLPSFTSLRTPSPAVANLSCLLGFPGLSHVPSEPSCRQEHCSRLPVGLIYPACASPSSSVLCILFHAPQSVLPSFVMFPPGGEFLGSRDPVPGCPCAPRVPSTLRGRQDMLMAETMKVTYSHFPPLTEVLTTLRCRAITSSPCLAPCGPQLTLGEPGPQVGSDY